MKEPGEPEERKKARMVAREVGSRDYDKNMLMACSSTVTRNSIKLMLSVATGKNIPIFTRHIRQVYVSTDTTLLRDIYLIPPKELNLDSDIL